MSCKKSGLTVQKNSKIWTKCLTRFENSITLKRNIADIDEPLYQLDKIPNAKNIIGRFHALAKTKKSKKERYTIISNELYALWNKMNIPKVGLLYVNIKVRNLIRLYEKSLKYSYGTNFENVFSITKKSTDLNSDLISSEEIMSDTNSVSMYESEEQCSSEESDYKPPARMKFNESLINPSVALVTNVNVSTRKAAKICKELAVSGVKIATPSQPAIYKAVIKSSNQKEEILKATLKNESWCLHFDGKKINKKEIQVIVLKNESKEIKLAVLVLENGKANTIFNGIKETLSKFDLWKCIKMIICDTTSVNTGSKNGVVTQLKNYYYSIHLPPPQYVGCQHHILDLLLRHVMDELLDGKTSSPEISYNFVEELIKNYKELQQIYKQNEEQLEVKNIKWRDDMQFLYELGSAFRYFQKNKKFPKINFKTIPSLSNARWNSRAILAILAFILLPKYQTELYQICQFICGKWFDIWFSDQCFNEETYEALQLSLTQFKSAHACFGRHWVKEASIIPMQQRSNICAERAIKVVQDIYPLCKSTRTLNLKFISFNN